MKVFWERFILALGLKFHTRFFSFWLSWLPLLDMNFSNNFDSDSYFIRGSHKIETSKFPDQIKRKFSSKYGSSAEKKICMLLGTYMYAFLFCKTHEPNWLKKQRWKKLPQHFLIIIPLLFGRFSLIEEFPDYYPTFSEIPNFPGLEKISILPDFSLSVGTL